MHGFEIVLGLVVLATVGATLAERLRAPAPSLLAVLGLAIGLLPGVPDVELDPQLVALVVLPPLLYAAATEVAVSELVPILKSVSVLAVGLVAATAAAVGVVTHTAFPQVSLAGGFVLGAILASTDPVAVAALARSLHLPPRLLALVQGESLLNDATSLVLFKVTLGLAVAGSTVSVLGVVGTFLRLGVGGGLVGFAAALLSRGLRRRVHDPVTEIVMALVLPYAVYVVAESIGTSGVTAVVIAGLQLGRGAGDLELSTGRTRLQIATVYSVVQFLFESVIFAVIGLQLPVLVHRLVGDDRQFALGSLAIITVVLGIRAVWVYPTTYLPHLASRLRNSGPTSATTHPPRPRWQVPTVICWVGTRGVVPLAAALSIPLTTASGAEFPHRDLLLVLTGSCVLTTLVVQGFTLAPLVRLLGVTEDPADRRRQEAHARYAAAEASMSRLNELEDLEAAPAVLTSQIRQELTYRLRLLQQAKDATVATGLTGPDRNSTSSDSLEMDLVYLALRRDLLAAESTELLRLRDTGLLTEAVRRKIQSALDIQETGLEN